MTFKMKNIALAITSLSALALSSSSMAKDFGDEMIIVHPFQWPYKLIAEECEKNWGPAGMDGVQISQPSKHISGNNDKWWAVYQPLNWEDHGTMTGSESELKDMISRCNKAGVKVFADAVFNQRGDESLSNDDYHNNGCTITHYTDADHVRTCALSGMRDVATDRSETQDKIVSKYLLPLLNLGVYGFRIDAAKHMGYTDLASIANKLKSAANRDTFVPMYYEVIGNSEEATDIQPNKYTNNPGNVVTDFSYVWRIADAYHWKKDYKLALELGKEGDVEGEYAEVFVNNHDDEWGRCSAGTCSMPTQNYANYNLAQSWLVVWPHGKVRQVYSGYQFQVNDPSSNNPKAVSTATHDQGGPLSSGLCTGGWLCQHRVPMVLNATRFARATRGQGVTTKGYDDGLLWFNRGSKGFYAQNTTDSAVTHEFKVEMADGTYCDILGQTDPCGGAQITVKSGKATFTIQGKSAAAICIDDQGYCGKAVDPCEVDPTSAACKCKDDSDKSTCDAYCNSTGKDTQECFCKNNPEDDQCVVQQQSTKTQLCYAGSSNNWTFEKMTFNSRTGDWELDVTLTGEGEKSGTKQRFKITDGSPCAWKSGTIYGQGSGNTLELNAASDGDVYITEKGEYTLKINDKTMEYKLVEKTTVVEPVANFKFSVNDATVTFTNSSTNAASYAWDFGDGTTSTEKAPKHTYTKSGTYTVKLTANNASGKTSTVSNKVEVTVPQVEEDEYSAVAVRPAFDNYLTHKFTKKATNEWVLTGFEFPKDSKFKIEAKQVKATQCIIMGGVAGSSLTAAGDFIQVKAGTYDITFNAKTNTVTLTQTQTGCVGDKCGEQCNKGSDCVEGVCQGSNCSYEEPTCEKCGQQCNTGADCKDGVCVGDDDCSYVQGTDDTKTNCTIDDTTNNCENSANAYDFLGAQYSKDKTTFRIWSPDSSNVTVDVNNQTVKMNKVNLSGYSDVYEAVVEGDLDGKTYQFKVNGKSVRDPYGKMVVAATHGATSTASDNRNVVMNMRKTDLANGWTKRPEFKNREDAIIYEAHVRDFTIDETSGVSKANKGRYLGMVEQDTTYNGLKTGIDHLKELGVTHVQLLPVYDYGTCSDVDSQSDSCYNWGYDPVNFNVPESRYTSVHNTDKYEQQIFEFKKMVDEFHKNGIRVIMDVVYNHTYNKTVFGDITGKYYTSTDLSGCGNSTDAKNDMVARFIRDSLEYWATEYNIDGFRFDLVGIFDVDDFKDWGEYLNNKYPDRNFLIYGEPWNGYATDPSESTRVRMGSIRNAASGHVGVFNGKYRECLKGASDKKSDAFIFNSQYSDLGAGVSNNVECVSAGIKGAIGDNTNAWTPLFAADPEQSINYLSAHDNLTLWDRILKNVPSNNTYAKRIQSYSNGIIFVSQGIPFIHAGAEFGRTKNGNENSYNTPGSVNNINWSLKKTNNDIYTYYKEMIAMRKAHPAFRFTTKSDIEANVKTMGGNSGEIIVDINGEAANDSWKKIKMVIHSGDNVTVSGVDGWYKKVHGVTVNADDEKGTNVAEGTAVTIWYQK